MIERDVINSAVEAIQGLLKFAPVCYHTNTHRGGSIWEICDDCGAEWADDRGGKPEYEDPAEVEAALIAIDSLEAAKRGLDKESWIDAEQISRERIIADEIVDRAARRAARHIWEDCLDRNGIKFALRDTDSATKYKEILPAWVDIIKREILGE